MSKIKLMGARHFIDMPVGTMYFRLDGNDNVKNIFKENPKSLIDDFEDIEVYGNNNGSMALSYINYEEEGTYLFYYDANIVGDASPENTLYFVFDEDFLPNEIILVEKYMYSGDKDFTIVNHVITKAEFLEMRKEFIGYFDSLDNANNKENDWARAELDKHLTHPIINAYLEWEIEQ